MTKVVAAINVTFDGFCDHTAGIANPELHQHYTDLLNNSGAVLYGRTTYQLMEDFWPTVIKNPTGNKTMDDFAVAIENVPKVLFSRTVKSVDWKNVRLATKLIDEWQLCVHPVITGKGLPLFKNITDRIVFNLLKIEPFKTSGHVTFYYVPGKE